MKGLQPILVTSRMRAVSLRRAFGTKVASITMFAFTIMTWMIAVHASPCIAEVPSEPQEQLEHLRTLWRTQRDLQASAHYRGMVFRGGLPNLKLTPEEALAKLSVYQLPAQLPELLEARRGFCRMDSDFTPCWGDAFEVHFQNGKLRERWLSREGQGYQRDRLYNGERSSDFRPGNRQYDVYEGRSFIGYLSPERIRCLPVELEGPILESHQKDGSISLKGKIWELESNPITGFVSMFKVYHPSGKINCVIYGLDPMTTDDGQVYPARKLTLNFDLQGNLYGVDLIYLSDFQSNLPLDESLFQMSTVAGAKLVDYRQTSGSQYRVVNTGSGGQDVFTLADLRELRPSRQLKVRTLYFEFMVIGAGIALIWWMVHRRSRLAGQ